MRGCRGARSTGCAAGGQTVSRANMSLAAETANIAAARVSDWPKFKDGSTLARSGDDWRVLDDMPAGTNHRIAQGLHLTQRLDIRSSANAVLFRERCARCCGPTAGTGVHRPRRAGTIIPGANRTRSKMALIVDRQVVLVRGTMSRNEGGCVEENYPCRGAHCARITDCSRPVSGPGKRRRRANQLRGRPLSQFPRALRPPAYPLGHQAGRSLRALPGRHLQLQPEPAWHL